MGCSDQVLPRMNPRSGLGDDCKFILSPIRYCGLGAKNQSEQPLPMVGTQSPASHSYVLYVLFVPFTLN